MLKLALRQAGMHWKSRSPTDSQKNAGREAGSEAWRHVGKQEGSKAGRHCKEGCAVNSRKARKVNQAIKAGKQQRQCRPTGKASKPGEQACAVRHAQAGMCIQVTMPS
jgi:hypothetical protein